MNMELEKYIESLEKDVIESQICFFNEWNREIQSHLNLKGNFRIEKYINLFGGYLLDSQSFYRMDDRLIVFFQKRVKSDAIIYLRGYDYYQADPLMHLHRQNYKHQDLWAGIGKRWKEYSLFTSFDFFYDNSSFENWIGSLGLLEYIFEDLTVIRWFLFRNKKNLSCLYPDDYGRMVESIEKFSEVIADSLACLLKFDFDRVKFLCNHYYHKFFSCHLISEVLEREYDQIDRASTRTIREGDSLPLIYAAYRMKLKPVCEEHRWKRIGLVSNAFGAMNIGLILKYLIAPICEAEHTNVLYAQHRTTADLIYEDCLTDQCYYLDPKEDKIGNAEAVFVIDDSICLGKSYHYIRDSIAKEKVYLLPLTLNCNGMKYFRVGVCKEDDIESMIHQSAQWAREVNGCMPPFFSFWDFRLTVSETDTEDDENEAYARYGSDLLLKHLWKIYDEEIHKHEQK